MVLVVMMTGHVMVVTVEVAVIYRQYGSALVPGYVEELSIKDTLALKKICITTGM